MALEEIRAEIDRIDDAMLGLLAERMAAVEAVRAAKASLPAASVTAMRPGREAEIIRRLVARAGGKVPSDLVERVWREIIGSATRFQIPHIVHVASSGTAVVALPAILGRFGTATPVADHGSAADAVRAIAGDGPDVAVVGPHADGDDWVSVVLGIEGDRPRVEACLPFLDAGAVPEGLVIGRAPFDPTGDDTAVIAVLPAGQGKSEPGSSISIGGRDLPVVATSGRWRLVGADYKTSRKDQFLEELTADASITRAEIVGAYANPILPSAQA